MPIQSNHLDVGQGRSVTDVKSCDQQTDVGLWFFIKMASNDNSDYTEKTVEQLTLEMNELIDLIVETMKKVSDCGPNLPDIYSHRRALTKAINQLKKVNEAVHEMYFNFIDI